MKFYYVGSGCVAFFEYGLWSVRVYEQCRYTPYTQDTAHRTIDDICHIRQTLHTENNDSNDAQHKHCMAGGRPHNFAPASAPTETILCLYRKTVYLQ